MGKARAQRPQASARPSSNAAPLAPQPVPLSSAQAAPPSSAHGSGPVRPVLRLRQPQLRRPARPPRPHPGTIPTYRAAVPPDAPLWAMGQSQPTAHLQVVRPQLLQRPRSPLAASLPGPGAFVSKEEDGAALEQGTPHLRSGGLGRPVLRRARLQALWLAVQNVA